MIHKKEKPGMPLPSEENQNQTQVDTERWYPGRRNSDRMAEVRDKAKIDNLIQHAALKESVGMELKPEEQFLLDNRKLFKRMVKK